MDLRGVRTDRSAWTDIDKQMFKLLLQKFGVGQWKQIIDSGLLPRKFNSQMVGMTQRLLGSQSLARYSGLKLDIDRIKLDNDQKDAHRKSKMIINNNLVVDKEQLRQQRIQVQQTYGLTDHQMGVVDRQIAQLRALQNTDSTNGHLLEKLSEYNKYIDRKSKIARLQQSLHVVESFVDTVSCMVIPAASGVGKVIAAGDQATIPQRLGYLKVDPNSTEGQQQFSNTADVGQQSIAEGKSNSMKASKIKKRKRTKPKNPGGDGGGAKIIDQYVQQLQDMGFPRRMACDALAEVEYDIDAAAIWLLQNVQV